MINDIYGEDVLYSISYDVKTKSISVDLRGESADGVLDTWRRMRESFTAQIESIFSMYDVETISFGGDSFGKELFNLCRLDLKDVLESVNVISNYDIDVKSGTMRLMYVDGYILCASRNSIHCGNGIDVIVDAPIDSQISIRNSKGTVLRSSVVNGIAHIPCEFLDEGKYTIVLLVPDMLPTNVIKMKVENVSKGRFARYDCNKNDVFDAVCKLMTSVNHLQQTVSAHIDGYDVI